MLFSDPAVGSVFSKKPCRGGVSRWKVSWSGEVSKSVAPSTPPQRQVEDPSSTTSMGSPADMYDNRRISTLLSTSLRVLILQKTLSSMAFSKHISV